MEVAGGTSSGARLWDWGIVAEVLVDLQERPGDILSTVESFCSSGLGLMESF